MKGKLRFFLVFSILVSSTALRCLAQEPVRFMVLPPEAIRPGDSFEVMAKFSTAPGWYIYAPTGRNQGNGMVETSLKFVVPEGVELNGSAETPIPKIKGMYEIYEGNKILIKQKFNTMAHLQSGVYEITASVTYQTCNHEMCLPPYTENLKLKLIVN